MAGELYDLYSLPDEPSAEEKRTALVNALKARAGQRQMEGDVSGAMGGLGLLTGDKVLGRFGQAQMAEAHNLRGLGAGQEGDLAQAGKYFADQRGEQKKFGLMQALQARREALQRQQHLSDIQSQRTWQEGRDAAENANRLEAARIAAQKAGAPKPVTAAEATSIGQLQTGADAVDQLSRDWDTDTGALSGVAQYLPGTDASQYVNKANVAAQVVGGILEGGKLGEADLPRYKAMMPQPGDSKETKAKKVATIKQMLDLKRTGQIQGLSQAGYDTSGFAGPKGGSFDLAASSEPVPDGKKWQVNKKTGERRLVPK